MLGTYNGLKIHKGVILMDRRHYKVILYPKDKDWLEIQETCKR